MAGQVLPAFGHCLGVLLTKIVKGHTAVHLQCAYRGDNNRSCRLQSRFATFDVEELLRAEIGAKASLRNDVVGEFQARLC